FSIAFFLLAFYSLNNSCTTAVSHAHTDESSSQQSIDLADTNLVDELDVFRVKRDTSYAAAKSAVLIERNNLRKLYQSAASDSMREAILEDAGIAFTDGIVYRLLPYWYGTPWDFNGYTDVPGEGVVACGYLVSTTLKHAGLNLNRYKLAQQAASVGLKSLALGTKVEILQDKSPAQLEEHFVKNEKPGLYKLGLDYHVGYLYFSGSALYFMHSSYLGPVAVTVERFEHSPAAHSGSYYYTSITHNHKLMRKWLLGEEIAILKS
ncbi:MAG: hypothetical protein ACKVOR_14705, partial [Flavobacteriales bacterium]